MGHSAQAHGNRLEHGTRYYTAMLGSLGVAARQLREERPTELTVRGGGPSIFGPGVLDSAGKILLPATTTNVLVDIGAWQHSVYSRFVCETPGTFLIAIEPMWESFVKLNASSTSHCERILPLRAAVAPRRLGSEVTLHVVSGHMAGQCSSLRASNPKAGKYLPAGCRNVTRNETVPLLPLEELLLRLPRGVAFLKIDAQGLDMEVIESGADLVEKRVAFVQMEMQDVAKAGRLMYGQRTQQQIVAGLSGLGFGLLKCLPFVNSWLREHNCIFRGRNADQPGSAAAEAMIGRLVKMEFG